MSPQVLLIAVFLAGAAGLLLHVLREGRNIDDLDPRLGEIVYEDVEKPDLPGVKPIEDSETESVPYLYYVDNQFQVQTQDHPTQISLVLQGKADRIVRKRDGAVHVIDYKSGSSDHPAAETETKLPDKSEYYRYQLMAYFLMIEQSLGEAPTKAVIDFLDGSPFDFTEIENTPAIRQECLELLRRICAVKLGEIPQDWLEALDRPA